MTKPGLMRSFAVVSVLAVVASWVLATPPKPSQKTKPKPKANTAQLASKGTSQLPGAWCDFGKSYTLGKGDQAINFCITSAEYKTMRVKAGDSFVIAGAGRKLLVINGFIHNCQPAERWFSRGSLKITAVDADSENTDMTSIYIASTGKDIDQTVKPAQKIECYAVIDVTGKGEIPKLMVANNGEPNAPIARYDLKGKVGKVEELYRDANDKTGATALDEGECKLGTMNELDGLNIKVDWAGITEAALPERTLDEGYTYATFSFETTNLYDRTMHIGGSEAMYEIRLIDADGVSYDTTARAVAMSSNRELDLEAAPGKTIKYRTYFSIPKGIQLKTLSIKVYDRRQLNFDVSAYKS